MKIPGDGALGNMGALAICLIGRNKGTIWNSWTPCPEIRAFEGKLCLQ